MQKYTASLIIKHLRGLYEKDRVNSYTLDAPFGFIVDINVPDYHGKLVSFERGSILFGSAGTFHPYGPGVCDGATLAPDKPRGVVEGTLAHDPAYLELDNIAKAWKDKKYDPGPFFRRDLVTRLTTPKDHPTWTKADVRQFLDTIFANAMRQFGAKKTVQRTYYGGVRMFGGIYRAVAGSARVLPLLFAVILFVFTLAGCSGCLIPPDIIHFPDSPEYTKQK